MNLQTLVKYFSLALLALPLSGAERAVVTDSRVNVRAQAYLYSEVVTQLKKDDEVTILERIEIPLEKQKPNEPLAWAKIKMPNNTPVWVFAPYVENGRPKVNKLNLRAGPGENFSVVGRVDRTTDLKIIRTVEDWTEIETPEEAYGFVDASLLKAVEGSAPAETTPEPIPATTETTPPAIAEPAATSLPESTTAEVIKPEITQPAAAASETSTPATETSLPIENILPSRTGEAALASPPPATPAPAETVTIALPAATAPSSTVPAAASPANTPPAASATPTLPAITPAEETQPAAALPKRVVTREGIVRSTVSVQAPTYFALIHPETKKAVNYLHSDNIDIVLNTYRDKKVVVTGSEGIDPRWPNTPVITVETIQNAP